MTPNEQKELITVLKERFEDNSHRHPQLEWEAIEEKLLAQPNKLQVLAEMERTGGEPDVVSYDSETDTYSFCDCCSESPAGRRSICYDGKALAARKKNKPETSAMELATAMGIEMLNENQYRDLQSIEEFDKKTSSWIKTPEDIRELGGALFCDRRYGQVFTYHNGADSYYAARGFRGILTV